MSLKAFHIVFISLSVLMCISVGALCFRNYFFERSADQLALGLMASAAAMALLVYFRLFLKKFKEVGLL